jgi:hypothetical protein
MVPLTRKDEVESLCRDILDTSVKGLNVPEEYREEDQEARVVVDRQAESAWVKISFTEGPEEYPGAGPFYPTKEQKKVTGREVQTIADNSEVGKTKISIEAWRNTTFKICEEVVEEPISPQNLDKLREIGTKISEPTFTLVLSPAMLGNASQTKEGEPSRETELYQNMAEEMNSLVRETLGIKEENRGGFEVVYAEVADADVSVEFDCQPGDGEQITEEHREYVAAKLEKYLNEKGMVGQGNAEIWIRQGFPETHTFTSV